ncbi:MAG: DUF4416 family protein [Deltaproteobacteria bacterium]
MGRPCRPLPAKLIIGFIWNNDAALDKALRVLTRRFGPTDARGPDLPFDGTDYYVREMGPGLKRTFVGFRRLIRTTDLPAIKLGTNALEKRLAPEGRRRVNIDPGYVSLAKLVLATTKNYCHRLYAGRGIFEEVTLSFRNNAFEPLAHTYPDLRRTQNIAFFNAVRALYMRQITSSYGHAALSRCP